MTKGSLYLAVCEVLHKCDTKHEIATVLRANKGTVGEVVDAYGITLIPNNTILRQRVIELSAIHPHLTLKDIGTMIGANLHTVRYNCTGAVDTMRRRTAETVEAVRQRIKLGLSQAEIARALGIHRRAVWQIVTTHKMEKPVRKPRNGAEKLRKKNQRKREAVWKWLKEGVSIRECARKAQVAPKTVQQWKKEMLAMD